MFVRSLPLVVACLLLTALPGAVALANVNKVEVIAAVEGTSPVDAKKKAIEYVQKRAFFLTLSKYAPQRARDIAESLTEEQILSHVRGYELIEDRIDRSRPNYYLAKYEVSISEPMVQRLLSNDAANDGEINPMLILPVFRDKGSLMLWDDANVWRSIWNGVALEAGEGILVVPYGDPSDRMTADNSNVLNLGFEQLKAMAERYGTGEVVVAVATPAPEETPPGIEIILRRLGPDVNKVKTLYFETDQHYNTPESLLPVAARSAAEQLKEIARTYQGEQLRRIANANRATVIAEFTRLDQWIEIKRKLEALPRVVELQIDRINIDKAEVTLLYGTTPEMMQNIMSANGLFVSASETAWTVRVP